MSSFELNKIAAAVIIALMTLKVSDLVSDGIVAPKKLEKQAFVIEGVEVKSADGGAGASDVVEPIEPLLASANVENGKTIFKKCAVCHDATKGGANKVGPNLYGIVGHPVGKTAGFAYSSAMAGHGGSWDYHTLNTYLHKPREVVPGTKMAFAGLSKAQDRADVVAYLRQQADAPAPLPQ